MNIVFFMDINPDLFGHTAGPMRGASAAHDHFQSVPIFGITQAQFISKSAMLHIPVFKQKLLNKQ